MEKRRATFSDVQTEPKCENALLSPDKHKSSAEEGVLCLQQRLAYDLEGLCVVAKQSGFDEIKETRGTQCSDVDLS
ncbi:MAG TPA: hypothetical protein DEO65_18750 [Bacillus bacterium]|uniref:Uncharacterized protein n=1 Tax=Siminovitchia fordii TaxID=254759 RepID=A0ABQ4K9W5_9BACI|nr:hypothetical protein J1TS3_35100 [Siminovitchia fordii]HBZ11876.1 hypothetical protein [Bacillus sp. (in: firmicutes)]